jgi:hypothetical protein
MKEGLFITIEVHDFPPEDSFEIFAAVSSKHWYKRLFGLTDYYPLPIVALNNQAPISMTQPIQVPPGEVVKFDTMEPEEDDPTLDD